MRCYDTLNELEDNVDFDYDMVLSEKTFSKYLKDLLVVYEENRVRLLNQISELENERLKTIHEFIVVKRNIDYITNPDFQAGLKESKEREIRLRFLYDEAIKCCGFLKDKIENERINILRREPKEKIENKIELSTSEIDRIRLLHKTGIIDFLLTTYHINENQIAKFFELISEKPMIAKNNNSLFYGKGSIKYPLANLPHSKKKKLDDQMREFGFEKK